MTKLQEQLALHLFVVYRKYGPEDHTVLTLAYTIVKDHAGAMTGVTVHDVIAYLKKALVEAT